MSNRDHTLGKPGVGEPLVTVSIVSHRQETLARRLLGDLQRVCDARGLRVVLTLNVPESLSFDPDDFPFDILVVRNDRPKGFGANHNAAFGLSRSPFFCVMNPDIRVGSDPFPRLVEALADPKTGVVAPLVVNPDGGVEDSARKFPTPMRIARRIAGGPRRPDYGAGSSAFSPDWIAGMFMLFRRDTFSLIEGFDERFFLYLEDVDLCARLRLHDLSVSVLPSLEIVHEARRDSHRRLRYLWWHASGMLRFFARCWLGRYRRGK